MQVWLPAATKANSQGAGADVKASGLFSGASHLEDGGPVSQSPSPLSVEAGAFIRRERGTEQRYQGRG